MCYYSNKHTRLNMNHLPVKQREGKEPHHRGICEEKRWQKGENTEERKLARERLKVKMLGTNPVRRGSGNIQKTEEGTQVGKDKSSRDIKAATV